MTDFLEFPELCSEDAVVRSALEVGLDFIPKQYEGRWLDVVREFTAQWVEHHGLPGEATIWMHGAMSATLANRRAKNPQSSWSEFLVEFGFPPAFFPALTAHVEQAFERRAAVTGELVFSEEDGWLAICHVEDGRVWRPASEDLFELVNTPSTGL